MRILWQKARRCTMVSIFFSALAAQHVLANADTARIHYEQTLAEVNLALNHAKTRGDAFCPISSLIGTCGDALCEWPLENTDTCPSDCVVAYLKSFNRQISCEHVQALATPSSVPEVQSIIADAHMQNKHVRVVGSRHSANRQYCTDGVAISMEHFNRIIGLEELANGEEVVSVEAGVTLGDLAEWLHHRGRSLGYAQLGFRLASVGGSIANGAHGSSHKHSAVVSSLVRAVTLITAAGEVKEIDQDDGDLMKAVRAHLGLLGVVVRVKLHVIPQFKLHVRVTDHDDDALFSGVALKEAISDCDYVFLNWFPNEERFIKACGKETNERAEVGAESVLLNPNFPPGLVTTYKTALHYGMCYPGINALLESLRYNLFLWQAPFHKRSIFGFGPYENSDDLVGYAHRMMSSKFIVTAESFFQDDREIAVPISRIGDALLVVRDYILEQDMHFPLFGVFLRFAPSEDTTLLAHTTSEGAFIKGEPVVFVEMVTPDPVGFPQPLKEAILAPFEAVSKTLITDFNGRPHWGKNQDWAFSLANDLQVYGAQWEQFLGYMSALDKNGMFGTAFTKRAGLFVNARRQLSKKN